MPLPPFMIYSLLLGSLGVYPATDHVNREGVAAYSTRLPNLREFASRHLGEQPSAPLLDRLLQGLARPEGRNRGGRDLHLLPALRISALPGLLLPHVELSKARQLDLLARPECLRYDRCESLQVFLCFVLGRVGVLDQPLDQLLFVHACRTPCLRGVGLLGRTHGRRACKHGVIETPPGPPTFLLLEIRRTPLPRTPVNSTPECAPAHATCRLRAAGWSESPWPQTTRVPVAARRRSGGRTAHDRPAGSWMRLWRARPLAARVSQGGRGRRAYQPMLAGSGRGARSRTDPWRQGPRRRWWPPRRSAAPSARAPSPAGLGAGLEAVRRTGLRRSPASRPSRPPPPRRASSPPRGATSGPWRARG